MIRQTGTRLYIGYTITSYRQGRRDQMPAVAIEEYWRTRYTVKYYLLTFLC